MAPRRSTRKLPVASTAALRKAAPYETAPTETTPFLSLTPELVDYILAFLIPKNTPTARRELARSLLAVNRSITPLVRRRLFAKVGLTVDHPKARDELLLEVMKTEGVSEMVRALRIRAPAVEPGTEHIQDGSNPGAALVPSTTLPQKKVVEMVTTALGRAKGLRALEMETRVGTKGEDESDQTIDWDDEAYREALQGLTMVETLAIAVPHPHLKLQLLADASGLSAFIPTMASWSHLTSIDLWRVRIQFPKDAVVPEPTFSLREIVFQSSELGGAAELVWLFGAPGSKRGSRLEKALIKELDYIDTPGSSSPLLAILPCDPATPPAFALSLDSLVFNISHPITDSSDTSQPSLKFLFSSLEVLRQVELGGAGITTPILESLFTPNTGLKPIAQRLEVLNFAFTPAIPQRDLLDVLSANSSNLPRLHTMDFILQGGHPRTWSWERISSTPLPFWYWPPMEWRELEKWVRALGRRKGRIIKPGYGVVVNLKR